MDAPAQTPQTEADWLALVVWDEARGEPDAGKAAVARVVLNRARARYADPSGTIEGAVLCHDQFSGFWFDRVDGRYQRVCDTPEAARAKAARLFALAAQNSSLWADCARVAAAVLAGTWSGPGWACLTDRTLLYLNPDCVERLPGWADPAKRVCTIGHHQFFED